MCAREEKGRERRKEEKEEKRETGRRRQMNKKKSFSFLTPSRYVELSQQSRCSPISNGIVPAV